MAARAAHARTLADLPVVDGSFQRVDLRDATSWVQLIIEPGAPAALSVEGPAEVVRRVRTRVANGTLRVTLAGTLADKVRDALTTSLTRQQLTYRLRADGLVEVVVRGLVQVTLDGFGAERPVITRLEPTPPIAPHPGLPFGPDGGGPGT